MQARAPGIPAKEWGVAEATDRGSPASRIFVPDSARMLYPDSVHHSLDLGDAGGDAGGDAWQKRCQFRGDETRRGISPALIHSSHPDILNPKTIYDPQQRSEDPRPVVANRKARGVSMPRPPYPPPPTRKEISCVTSACPTPACGCRGQVSRRLTTFAQTDSM